MLLASWSTFDNFSEHDFNELLSYFRKHAGSKGTLSPEVFKYVISVKNVWKKSSNFNKILKPVQL